MPGDGRSHRTASGLVRDVVPQDELQLHAQELESRGRDRSACWTASRTLPSSAQAWQEGRRPSAPRRSVIGACMSLFTMASRGAGPPIVLRFRNRGSTGLSRKALETLRPDEGPERQVFDVGEQRHLW